MTNRSVLIVTPYFAPQSHAAVFRAYKLAKYLPEYGWKPYVVTTDINYLYNEDPRLLDALPPEVEIHRARYIEPSVRGMRMALGGRDRTFKAMKAKIAASRAPQTPSKATLERPNKLNALYRHILETWVRVPDAHWTWERPAIRLASDLIQRHQIPLVFTSADPYTSHRIGYQLKQQGARWIADFRDPHTHHYTTFSKHMRVFAKQRAAELAAVTHADAVTVAAESIALILTETYGLQDEHPIHFIPTGLDDVLLNADQAVDLPTTPYLIFIGEFLPSYGDRFFQLFARALADPVVADTGIQLLFIGRSDVNAPRVQPIIQQYELEANVRLLDHMPQETLYAYVTNAKAALLPLGHRTLWWCLSAKLLDYIALHKPVIAIVPDPSEARTHLQRSGLGIFLDDNDDKAVEQLKQIICGDVCQQEINTSYCDRFLVKAQVERFVDIFQSLTAAQACYTA